MAYLYSNAGSANNKGRALHGDHLALKNGSTGPGELRIYEDSSAGSNFFAIKAQDMSGDVEYTWPAADGSSGQQLQTAGNGTLTWAAAGTATGAQTNITTDYNAARKVGRDSDNQIDFATDDTLIFKVGGANEITMVANEFSPTTSDGISLGTTSKMWSDLHLASGAVINFNNSDVTATHSSNTLTIAGGTLATAALTTSTIVASGIVKTDDATEATSATDGSLQTDGGLSVVKSAVIGDDLDLLSNGAILNIGSDEIWTATHANANDTLTVSANHRLAFGDAGDYIAGTGTDLQIISSGDLDVTATLVDVTGAGTFSGILKTDDTTAATSTTDGSLQTDGGLSVALDAVVGDDLILLSDAAVVHFGASKDVTLTHVADVGLTITHIGTGDNLPVVLQLKSEENAVIAGEVIASLEFAAGDSDGTDGATVAAGIHAIAEGTFAADANATKLVFTTGVSETAASSATAKATLSSIGDFQVAGDLVVKDDGLVGSDSAKDAMTISSAGKLSPVPI